VYLWEQRSKAHYIDVDILNNVMTLFYGQIWSAEFKYYCDTDNKCAKSVCIADRFGHRY
jgi:hypothetical protein